MTINQIIDQSPELSSECKSNCNSLFAIDLSFLHIIFDSRLCTWFKPNITWKPGKHSCAVIYGGNKYLFLANCQSVQPWTRLTADGCVPKDFKYMQDAGNAYPHEYVYWCINFSLQSWIPNRFIRTKVETCQVVSLLLLQAANALNSIPGTYLYRTKCLITYWSPCNMCFTPIPNNLVKNTSCA